MFRLLKMRPPNGWNAVAWELAIVTLGVLIALGGQQSAESFNERREAADTRAAIAAEIEETLAVLELRKAAEPCLDKRLKELRAIVDEWGRTGSYSTPRWVAQPPWFVINNLRFDAAQSAGRLALLPSEEQYRFGLITAILRSFRDIQADEMEAWAKLRMLQSGADALSESDRTAIRIALQEASLLNYRTKIVIGQALPIASGYGWRPDLSRFRQMLMPFAWKSGRFTPSVCVPIDTPPDQANRAANLTYEMPE